MATVCECTETIGNIALPKCSPEIGIITRVIYQPLFKGDGTLNSIDTTATLNAAYFDALQYNLDKNLRIYPLNKDLEEVQLPKEDPKYQEFSSGRKIKVRNGVRNFEAMLPIAPNQLIGKLNNVGCGRMGVYFITNTGQLVGFKRKGFDTLFFPIPLADDTLNGDYMFATDNEREMTKLQMQFDSSVLDENFSVLSGDEIPDLSTQLNGMLDINIAKVGTGTTTSVKVAINLDYGTAKTKTPVKGFVLADFTLYNTTTSLAVTPSAVVEAVDGSGYTFTFPAQTLTNVLRFGLAANANTKPFDASRWLTQQLITL